MKIRMVDSVCYDNWHLNFNSQLIEILTNVASSVEYRGAQKIGLNKLNVRSKNLYVIKGTGPWNIILRFIFTIFNDIWQLFISPHDQIIVYSFDATVSVRLINFINKILKKRIIMFRHGSMEMLQTSPTGKGIFYSFENNLTRQFFLNKHIKISSNLHFFVLGDIILKNLYSRLPENIMSNFYSIDHPYDFNRNTYVKKNKETKELNIGTVGVFNEYKGGKDFLQLAKLLKHKKAVNVNLFISGRINFNISLLKKAGINLPSNEGRSMISAEELNNRIDQLDFVLYFYPSDTYRLTASGAIFDAINRKRPIIAIRNDYFEYIFTKFGSIGYLVDSVSEMADIIFLISKKSEKNIDFDFEKVQNLLSVQNLTKIFSKQLQEIGFDK